GPFTTYPHTTYVVFAFNRGAGARLGPVFPQRPGITPDALVTVTIGPNGRGNSATLTDLTTGITAPFPQAEIRVAGPTVRVLVHTHDLPSTGFALKHYQFAFWTMLELGGGYSSVGSFLPEFSMIPIGVLANTRPTM